MRLSVLKPGRSRANWGSWSPLWEVTTPQSQQPRSVAAQGGLWVAAGRNGIPPRTERTVLGTSLPACKDPEPVPRTPPRQAPVPGRAGGVWRLCCLCRLLSLSHAAEPVHGLRRPRSAKDRLISSPLWAFLFVTPPLAQNKGSCFCSALNTRVLPPAGRFSGGAPQPRTWATDWRALQRRAAEPHTGPGRAQGRPDAPGQTSREKPGDPREVHPEEQGNS